MSQIAQLSESEIEERFHITRPTAIQFTLSGFAEHKNAFTVQFAEGREHFLTTLLAVDSERGKLIIDCSGSADLNKRFPESQRNIFVARPDGIHVQFSCGPARAMVFEGAPAFAVDLPRFIMRLQRRESFRIETPRVQPLQFHARLPSESLLTLPVHNISVACRPNMKRRNRECSDSRWTKSRSSSASSGRIARILACRPSGNSSGNSITTRKPPPARFSA